MENEELPKEFIDGIRKLVEASNGIYKLAEREFTPMVNAIIQSECTDFRKIDKLLDDMLSFACDERILLLFKELCRYSYSIYPELVADYVYAYRRLWDEGENEEETELN